MKQASFILHTEAWRDCWLVRVDKLIAGEKFDELIPLEFIDALILQGESDDESDRQAYEAGEGLCSPGCD